MRRIRVMVVDDSALMRKLITEMLEKDSEIEVVGTAMDGLFALKKIPLAKPDVITLDVDMPRMDGLTALRYIVNDYNVPVVLVSSLTTQGGALTLEGLALGAVDFVTKPNDAVSMHIHEIAADIIRKVKTASRISVTQIPRPVAQPRRQDTGKAEAARGDGALKKVVAIGVSTGGPNAISCILPMLPADFPGCVLIVQHMPEGFTAAFANRLNQACAIRVKEAAEGDRLLPGKALIAPGSRHLKVARLGNGGVAVLSAAPPVNGHRPSADVLFHSVSQEFGKDSIGVIMTGMGSDGASGLGSIKQAGGRTIAQDEGTCVVFGMPKAAIDMGNVDEVLPLEAIPMRLTALLKEVDAYA